MKNRRKVDFLWSHDLEKVLGSNLTGALSLAVDRQDLRFELEIPQDNSGRRLVLNVLLDGQGMSFGYYPEATNWIWVVGQRVEELLRLK